MSGVALVTSGLNCQATVERPDKGHFGTALFVLCKEVVLFGRLKMYKYCGRSYFGTSGCVLDLLYCVLIWESQLSEVYCVLMCRRTTQVWKTSKRTLSRVPSKLIREAALMAMRTVWREQRCVT